MATVSSSTTRVFTIFGFLLVFHSAEASPRNYRNRGLSDRELPSSGNVFSNCSQETKINTSLKLLVSLSLDSPLPFDWYVQYQTTSEELDSTCTRGDPFAQYLWETNTCTDTKYDKENKTTSSGKEHGSKWVDEKKMSRKRNFCERECRASDWKGSSRLTSKARRISRKMGFLPLPGGVHSLSVPYNGTQTSHSGKRFRRLESLTWKVDHFFDNRGQVGRNGRRTEANGTGWQATLLIAIASFNTKNRTMLLMSGPEGHDSEDGGNTGIIRDTLVSLAILVMVLGNRSIRRSAGSVRFHVSRSLQKSSCEFSRVFGAQMGSQALSKLAKFFSTSWGSPAFRHGGCSMEGTAKPPKVPDLFTKRPVGFRTDIWVAPVTGFLPSVSAHDKNHMDHTGYRMASLATLPPSCPMSRVKLAEAGFHFDPRSNNGAVVCHKCGITLAINENVSPLAYHHAASPNCEFLKNVLDTYTAQPASISSPTAPVSSKQSQEASGVSSMASGSLSMSSLPSSLGSASTSLSQPSTDSGMKSSSLGTVGSSMSSLSITSESSIASASTASGFASLPTVLPAVSCGAAVAAAVGVTSTLSGGKPLQADGGDQIDHRMELCTDGAEVTDSRPSVHSPMQTVKPTTHLADQPRASPANTEYFLALPTTSADISSKPTAATRDFSYSNSLTTGSAAQSAASCSNSGSNSGPKPSLDLSNAVYPQFGTVKARMETYAKWPLEQKFPANLMATLGFYYAGINNATRVLAFSQLGVI
ncbi:hypothetical protein BaRGS_00005603 [Batillaria attramentaria]|uniref:Uncharacterized protein n=1 Tax=Batillaria attramentaria TaxID=370345 RepID=A0ABD0LVK0_9CAEN